MSATRSHREPLRVVPARCLPADSLLPGQIPAQLAKCPAEGNWPMSVPISARMTSAVRWLTPGMVINRASSGERGDHPGDLVAEPVDGLVEVVQVRQQLAEQQGVMGAEAALQRLPQRR